VSELVLKISKNGFRRKLISRIDNDEEIQFSKIKKTSSPH
jgi:hypothetical protein